MALNPDNLPDGPLKRKLLAAIKEDDEKIADRRAGLSAANVEPDNEPGLPTKAALKEAIKGSRLRVHSECPRLGDVDGRSVKFALDGFILGGIIEDDGPAYIESVLFTQEKAKKHKTTLTFTWEEE